MQPLNVLARDRLIVALDLVVEIGRLELRFKVLRLVTGLLERRRHLRSDLVRVRGGILAGNRRMVGGHRLPSRSELRLLRLLAH